MTAPPDYFTLFHLEPRFDLDVTELTRRYRDVQSEIHPDRYAGKSAQEQRLAVQQAAFVNEAYQCLKQPLMRARYLLGLLQPQLVGAQVALDATFLMEQMELREQLDALTKAPVSKQNEFCDVVTHRREQIQQDFLREFNAKQYKHASMAISQWQFFDKLQQEADNLLNQYD